MRNNRLIKNVLLNPPIFGLRKDASVSNLVTSYLDTCDVIIEVGLLHIFGKRDSFFPFKSCVCKYPNTSLIPSYWLSTKISAEL